MMTIFGPSEQSDSMRSDLLRHFVFAAGSGGGAATVFYCYELLRQRPDQGFGLLKQWGPWFLIALVAMYFLWDLLKMALANLARVADGMQALSAAVEKIAEKDDRQYEEMQRLTEFSARQGQKLLDVMLDQGKQLRDIAVRLDAIGGPKQQ